ncbi:helix-turn-helix transcriptional regulator [Sphaerisporangium dianthi]|uniref:Helix-turn-helix transcriptional regulator n=1 Tax=Sphaerisporangium dianthi TaxID=1436120 RepID=A0ABV9CNA6_9ACTN
MTRARRPSPQTVAVLSALAAAPSEWRYGYELGRQVGLKAGSLYPILMRLSDRGMLETMWESDPPAGRPPRHLYRLTGPGLAMASAAAEAPASRVRSELRSAW